ncbi:hypothetical protein C7451_104214 [Blastomonas natatoria]|uniref:Uncharacterized protein n=2 Tax=Blastomonas natatoria TaxID=34015 RepID=A0A2V3VAD9_9SPHN|nr:hypothetical protein C7451_104214 [Blastomonas natatoria]
MVRPQRSVISPLAWLAAALAGIAAPTLAMVMLADAPAPLVFFGGPILSLGLMGSGMIAAAIAARLWVGIALALLTAAGLVLLAGALGMSLLPHPVSTVLAFAIAGFSFAARGKLFARSAADKGWWIALFVVAGEAAMLLTAAAMPGALPDWLLVLLPAQWASMAIQTALTGTGTRAASSALIALAGTGAVTLLVARLWPRRWPYALMFSAWLGLSALVWHRPAPPMPAPTPPNAQSEQRLMQPSVGIAQAHAAAEPSVPVVRGGRAIALPPAD